MQKDHLNTALPLTDHINNHEKVIRPAMKIHTAKHAHDINKYKVEFHVLKRDV